MVYFWFKKCVFILVLLCLQLYWLRAVQFNARSACNAPMFTSYIYIFLRLASKCLNCTRSPEEIVHKLHKYDWKHKINSLEIDSDNFSKLPVTFLVENNNENRVKFAKFFNILLITKEFILCFQSYLCSLCTISSGLRVQFRHLLANIWCKHWCITSWPRIELDRA